ncbi:type IV pilus modification PilV family protein [Natranaerobius thermophilus]|uniref:Prepilin-type N-terminal cleavage/methylation domain-containing protein n=1 Tax=Natranaerobius thermophilus (strain ATCC BAA-1301 / DSM 18059 / JW/NM-WN-LF) TaxID=457570 RepID=B2A561_NATTJ|nr:type II secretion system protein [Natranaerobius thermophilus]ACB85303.1 hypothetical protein Nther_1729 [Natranaerobius thermophilus JW/NM-WN-LF]
MNLRSSNEITTLKKSGFILLELLISLVILALIAGPIIALTIQGVKGISHSGTYSEASYLAKGELEVLKNKTYEEIMQNDEPVSLNPNFEIVIETTVLDEIQDCKLLLIEVLIEWEDETGKTSHYYVNTLQTSR